MLSQVLPNIDYPSAFANWLNIFLNFSEDNKELAVCGENAIKDTLLFQKEYLPNIIISGSEKPSELPFLRGRFQSGKNYFMFAEIKPVIFQQLISQSL